MDDVREQLHRFKQENNELEKELRENATAEQKARLLEKRVTENQITIENLRQERASLSADYKDLQRRYVDASEVGISLFSLPAFAKIDCTNSAQTGSVKSMLRPSTPTKSVEQSLMTAFWRLKISNALYSTRTERSSAPKTRRRGSLRRNTVSPRRLLRLKLISDVYAGMLRPSVVI
jgi:hypothetical protein